MNINCTVIIQICNFFLAWSILEKVLLKTVLEKLHFKKKIELETLDGIEKEKELIEELQQEQRTLWQNFNKYCFQNVPSAKRIHLTHTTDTYVRLQEVDPASVDSLSQEYACHINRWLKEVE